MAKLQALDDAAAASGLGRRTLQRWISEGRLTGYKVAGDRRRYVDVEQLEKLREPIALPKKRKRT